MPGFKQVIVVRADLRMSVGKTAVQTAHASILAYEETKRKKPEWVREWVESGQKKVVLKVGSEEDLRNLCRECASDGIPCSLVEDAGLTELPPGTITALGIGPAPEEIIDKHTRRLALL